MFRTITQCNSHLRCFPRARGDVPSGSLPVASAIMFSPRTRGCSVIRRPQRNPSHRFPRARGDVPRTDTTQCCKATFSPRTRGCSVPLTTSTNQRSVFPAHAGMFRGDIRRSCQTVSFPRARGDVPPLRKRSTPCTVFSPRTRGCSEHGPGNRHAFIVFPAHAGMFRVHLKHP